jgi:S1-C subfamily serine protease
LPINFLSDNDITGGNSGSPVLNGKGELIGLAFDGNIEAMAGDVIFDSNLQRTINVDIRFVLWLIDKYAKSSHIVDELSIVE